MWHACCSAANEWERSGPACDKKEWGGGDKSCKLGDGSLRYEVNVEASIRERVFLIAGSGEDAVRERQAEQLRVPTPSKPVRGFH